MRRNIRVVLILGFEKFITVLILEILKCGGSSPPCPKNVGAWSIKMGTCTSAKEGLISESFVCPYVC